MRTIALCLCLALTTMPTRGALSASATISTSQTSAPFTYTISLNNIGNTNIGTLWFAWTVDRAGCAAVKYFA